MVTKPTGRPRGRPRKPRPPPRPAHRPRQEFRDDPDRYAIALLDAILALEMGSERTCAIAVTTWLVGLQVDNPRPSDGLFGGRGRRRRQYPPGLIVTYWRWLDPTPDRNGRLRISHPDTRNGANTATLRGKAATLRIKQRRCRSAVEEHWRKVMASAFMLAIGARDPEAVKPEIVQRAASVGEGAFALYVMLPMVDAKFSLPEFSASFVSAGGVS